MCSTYGLYIIPPSLSGWNQLKQNTIRFPVATGILLYPNNETIEGLYIYFQEFVEESMGEGYDSFNCAKKDSI